MQAGPRDVQRLQIQHPPWRLQPAEAETALNTMAGGTGLPLPEVPPLLHFARRQDMAAWLPELFKAGVAMIGGCCGTTPAYIAAFRKVVDEWNRAHDFSVK